jgi:glutamate-1-semialdehyde 2,1-aminomutase
VLIFDEVVTGFRLAPGGAQEHYGVIPDLVAYGKALGGGFPIGAFAGRADIMEVLEERRLPGPRYLWSASTTGGNPVSCAAALATLDLLLQPGVHDGLHQLGRRFREGLQSVIQSAGESAQILGDGPLGQVAFSGTPVVDQTSWLASDRARGGRLMLELLARGIFLNPMGTKLYLSLDHSETILNRFMDAFAEALPASASPR